MNKDEQKIRKRVLTRRIGELCKHYRKLLGLTVRDVSRKTGYSTQLIYQFESGNTSNMVILYDCYFNLMNEDNQIQLMKDIIEVTGC